MGEIGEEEMETKSQGGRNERKKEKWKEMEKVQWFTLFTATVTCSTVKAKTKHFLSFT